MDFQLSDDQRALQDSARRFAQAALPALARRLEEAREPLPAEWLKRYAEMGFLGINLPEAYGGQGLSHLDAVLVLEEFARISGAVAAPIFESCFGPTLAILHYAGEALKRRLLPEVCAGERVIAVSMSEPGAGSALTDLKTRAVVDGEQVVLNGQKRWCSGAGHAEGYLVYTRLSDAPGAAAIGAVYVDKDTPGLSFGKREMLMGFRSTHHADIFLDGVRVPASQIVVPAGGFRKLMESFDLERCGNTTMSLGLAQSAFDDAVRYIQERRAFGRELAGAGLPSIADSSIAKCFANETVREVCIQSMQLMGGYGYSTEYPMEQRVRDSFGWGFAGGAIDIQKINIAGAVLGRRFDQRRA